MNVIPEDVARFLGREDDDVVIDAANEQLPLVAEFVRAYTRGKGFGEPTDDPLDIPEPNRDLRAVIITATARLVVNPAQLERESADGYTAVGAFNGFSLPELAVLHRYRRRTR